ncbi:cholecystokinin receptor-like [Dreissena polymorpha]|uniref:cholecystokinin receptor-like n=1 Tax=Dreissena polymorpha TaxID=45954 RepID=UPI0022655338|nr:cholecystokinin receptor-like [Dreissena polymorpha]
MRTITNLFLVNLAISDLMLSMLCMPFSLVATTLLRNFIFEEAMCVKIIYFQAVSVGVSCYTLVAISLERYYAICEPLRSRRWQTLSHARRMLIGIWASVLTVMSPIAMFHRVIKIQTGGQACREVWPEILLRFKIDVMYSILLAVILLLLPLLTMGSFYSLVARKLWMVSTQMEAPSDTTSRERFIRQTPLLNERGESTQSMTLDENRTNHDPSSRKRVIRMLVVVVLQYFLCWAPLTLLNSWEAFDFRSVSLRGGCT